MISSDRIFGLVVILGALAYIVSASQLQTSFLSDPMGSKTFPYILGGVAVLCGIVMVLRPDEEAEWPGAGVVLKLAFAVIVMIGYAYTIKPMGFLIPTVLASTILSYLITPRPVFNILCGLGLAIGLFALFRYGLNLETLQAFPKAWKV